MRVKENQSCVTRLMTVGVIVTALSVAPACATKKFVRTSVGEVNDKVTQPGQVARRDAGARARGRRPHHRGRRQGGGRQATRRARPTRPRPTRRTRPPKSASTAEARAAGIEAETRKLIFETVLSEDRGQFKLGKAELPDDATGAPRQDGQPAEGRQEGRVGRDRRPHRQHRRPEAQREARPRSAPKP